MRRVVISFICSFSVVISFAQQHPIGKAMNDTWSLLEQGKPKEALDCWDDNTHLYKTDSLYAWASTNMAMSFMNFGRFAESEKLINEAEYSLELFKSDSSWWWEHHGYLSTQKAALHYNMHDYRLARAYASDAKIAYEHISSRGMDYAMALSILAQASHATGHDVMARIFAGEAVYYALLVYNTTSEFEDLSSLSTIMRVSGQVDADLGYTDNAIKTFESLKEINRQTGSEDVMLDQNLGRLYVGNGDYEKALSYLLPLYEDCKQIQQKITVGINILYAKYMLGHDGVTQLAYEIAKLQSDNISRMFSFMSDAEKSKWWMSYENDIINIADAILFRSGQKGINGIIADNEIFTRGILLRSTNALKEAALSSGDDLIVNNYRTLEGLKSHLLEVSDKNEQSDLENKISSIEKELQKKLNVSVEKIASWKDITSSLERNEIALEFIKFDDLAQSDEASYCVVVLKKGDKEPSIVPLFKESELKKLLDNTSNYSVDQHINNLYSSDAPNSNGEKLYKLIWAKIEKEIKGCSTIYYSPVGLLNSISFQALSSGRQCLGQRYVMHLVSSAGVIPHLKNSSRNISNNAVIYGGIKYDVQENEMIEASRSYTRGDSNTWDLNFGVVRSGLGYLSGTDVEADDISSILRRKGYSVRRISGTDANEESFKALSGEEIGTVHVATHGFYLSEESDIKKNAFLNPLMSERVGYIDPMQRSGLLFAGANRAWTGKRSIDGVEDGILTAKEIATLDFSKVGLIVLSACQTGLGEVEANEGVYGLQRAFKLAGAETLVMSLWKVDDRATSILMKAFYEEYLNGENKDVAFKNAVNMVRYYKDEYGDKPFTSPYYWAAFIMLD